MPFAHDSSVAVASSSSHSLGAYNRAYLATVLCTFAQILFGELQIRSRDVRRNCLEVE